MPRYRLRQHPLVESDLALIYEWIVEYANREVAERKVRELVTSISGLAGRPRQGTRRDEIVPGLRAIPSAGRGVIAFLVDDAAREVLVLCVTYSGADWIGRAERRADL